MPKYFGNSSDELLDTAARVIEAINADDAARKVLSDLYETWREMLILCGVALSESALLPLCSIYP